MKRVITLQPYYLIDKIYFNRDVGQIGFTLQEKKGFLSEVWGLKHEQETNFEIKGQKWIGFKNKFQIYIKLYKKSKNINLLHMYHLWRYSLIGTIIYKLRNPKGKIYIKMDMPLKRELIDNRNSLKNVPKILMVLILKLVDYIGFEDKILQSFMINLYPKYKNKFILTTNGTVSIKKFIGNIDKENTITLTGRFGSEQKNNELLLKVLERNNIDYLKGWTIYLIGSYTDDFNTELNNLFISKPLLKNIIKKLGFLDKKEDLYKYLIKSKIVLHTANFEGDPNFQYDAMFCGCFMISTDVANIEQNYPEKYSIFYNIRDEIGLYKSLKKGIKINNELNKNDYLNIQNHCTENFIWEKSLNPLLKLL